jgi:hypothetical protein
MSAAVEAVNAELKVAYDKFKVRSGPLLGGSCDIFSPPYLVSTTQEYLDSNPRVLIVGSETFGWQWPGDELDRTLYPE